MESIRSYFLSGFVFVAAAGFCFYKQTEINKIAYENTTLRFENSIIYNDLRYLESTPNYEDGYRDAIIKMGGPQTAGSYLDGWNAAFKVIGANNYAEGYHTAIKQFGYTQQGSKWLIEEMTPVNNTNESPSKKPTK